MFKFFLGQNSIFKDRTVVRSTPAIRTPSTAPYSTAAAQCEAGRWPCEQQTDWKPVHLFWHVCLGGLTEEGTISIMQAQNKTLSGTSHKGDKKQRGKGITNPSCPMPNPSATCSFQSHLVTAGALPERWHSASMAAGCQMAPISCLPHSTPPPRSLCMKSTNYVKKHPGTTSPAINNCSF